MAKIQTQVAGQSSSWPARTSCHSLTCQGRAGPSSICHILTMVLSFLPVQGALLAYQCLGTGPLLLTIPGANGDAAIFKEVAPYLAQDFTVCTYDRRGYSNSTLTSPAPAHGLIMPYRLQRDADDAAALLSHVSGGDPGLVFGTSSGAIVALELLQRHAGLVDFLVAHEPPLAYVLGGSWAEET